MIRSELIQWMQKLTSDPWYKLNPVPMTCPVFLHIVGSDKHTVRFARRGLSRMGKIVSGPILKKLAPVMEAVEDGRLAFVHEYTPGTWGTPAIVAYWLHKPADPQPKQPPLVAREDYLYWSPCSRCGARRYAAVKIAGKRHAACFDCHPPHSYGTFGAEATAYRLVQDEIKKDRAQWGSCGIGPASIKDAVTTLSRTQRNQIAQNAEA